MRVFLFFALALLCPTSIALSNDFIYPTNPMPEPRQMHGSAVARDYLYIISGAGSSPTNTVMKASIGPDGQLSGWTQTTPLPQPRLYIGNSTIVLDDIIYVVGGAAQIKDNTGYRNAVYAKPDENGNLSRWVESVPWPGGELQAPVTVATPGYIHLIGGLDRDTPRNNAFSIEVRPDGHLGSQWERSAPLPVALWYHHAAVSAGRVYVWGGLTANDNKAVTPQIYSAPIMSYGKIDQWRRENISISQPYYAASTAVAGPFVIAFSPRHSGSLATSNVWWSVANVEGMQGWQSMQTQVPNRVYHAAAMDYRRGLVFLNGGRSSKTDVRTLLSNVVVFRLSKEARDAAYQGAQSFQFSQADDMTITSWQEADHTESSFASTDGGDASAMGASSVLANFKSFQETSRNGKPMAMLFYSDSAENCKEQIEILASGDMNSLSTQANFVLVPVNKDPQMVQQRGVWKVPTWIFFNRNGAENGRHIGTLPFEQLRSAVTESQ